MITNLEVRIARTEEEKHICYKIRYLSYLNVGYISENPSSDELTDKYDLYSVIFLVFRGDENLATVRMTKDSELGFEMEGLFDLSGLRLQCNSLWECSKMMAVPGSEKYNTALPMIAAPYMFAKKNGITDLCWMAHPDHARTYTRIGAKPFAETKIYQGVGQPAVPLLWHVEDTNEVYKEIFERKVGIHL